MHNIKYSINGQEKKLGSQGIVSGATEFIKMLQNASYFYVEYLSVYIFAGELVNFPLTQQSNTKTK